MTAREYPINFGYGEYDGVYYTASRPHRGNDRPTPTGTPIVIGDTAIGYTGATGLVSGPHLHTQAGTDPMCQNTVDPTPYEFKPGTVTAVGTASQWGTYVIVKVGSHYICYAHLSATGMWEGKVINEIEEEEMNTPERVKAVFRAYLYQEATDKDLAFWTVRPTTELDDAAASQRFATDAKTITALQNQLKAVQATLLNEQSKPPVEVIKEVEKIVEKTVYTHDETLTKDVASIRGMLVNFIGYVKAKLGR